MLPTPAKFHYIFNLRDLSRIWEGMLKIKGDECSDITTMLGLWKHECTRVIADRLECLCSKSLDFDILQQLSQSTVILIYPSTKSNINSICIKILNDFKLEDSSIKLCMHIFINIIG